MTLNTYFCPCVDLTMTLDIYFYTCVDFLGLYSRKRTNFSPGLNLD